MALFPPGDPLFGARISPRYQLPCNAFLLLQSKPRAFCSQDSCSWFKQKTKKKQDPNAPHVGLFANLPSTSFTLFFRTVGSQDERLMLDCVCTLNTKAIFKSERRWGWEKELVNTQRGGIWWSRCTYFILIWEIGERNHLTLFLNENTLWMPKGRHQRDLHRQKKHSNT